MTYSEFVVVKHVEEKNDGTGTSEILGVYPTKLQAKACVLKVIENGTSPYSLNIIERLVPE